MSAKPRPAVDLDRNDDVELLVVSALRLGPALFVDLRDQLADVATGPEIKRSIYRLQHYRRAIRNRVAFPVNTWHLVNGCPCVTCRERRRC